MSQGWPGRLALAAYLALMALIAAWELWLAPNSGVPRGFWLLVKFTPLLAALPGLVRDRVYTFQWSILLIMLYLVDGLMETVTSRHSAWTATSPLSWATAQTALAFAYFGLALWRIRSRRGH